MEHEGLVVHGDDVAVEVEDDQALEHVLEDGPVAGGELAGLGPGEHVGGDLVGEDEDSVDVTRWTAQRHGVEVPIGLAGRAPRRQPQFAGRDRRSAAVDGVQPLRRQLGVALREDLGDGASRHGRVGHPGHRLVGAVDELIAVLGSAHDGDAYGRGGEELLEELALFPVGRQQPLPLAGGEHLAGDLDEGEDQSLHLSPVVEDRCQRPVPVRRSAPGIVHVGERPGAELGGVSRVAHAAEDGLVAGVGEEVEVVASEELFPGTPAPVRVGLVDPDEVEVAVEVGELGARVRHDGVEDVPLPAEGADEVGDAAAAVLHAAAQRPALLHLDLEDDLGGIGERPAATPCAADQGRTGGASGGCERQHGHAGSLRPDRPCQPRWGEPAQLGGEHHQGEALGVQCAMEVLGAGHAGDGKPPHRAGQGDRGPGEVVAILGYDQCPGNGLARLCSGGFSHGAVVSRAVPRNCSWRTLR